MSPMKERLGGAVNQLPLFLGLVLLWALLWGKFSWLNLLTGAVFAAVVSVVFYLPAVQLSGRVNVWRTAWLFVKLLWDIGRASVNVAWLALGPNYTATNAIMAVHLRTRSDLSSPGPRWPPPSCPAPSWWTSNGSTPRCTCT